MLITHTLSLLQEQNESQTLYFQDGRRRIDFVLAHEENASEKENRKAKRDYFEKELRREGLELEYEEASVGVVKFGCIRKSKEENFFFLNISILLDFAWVLRRNAPTVSSVLWEEKKGTFVVFLDKYS